MRSLMVRMKRERSMLRGHRGFTLIELMIVVVIIGLLAAIAAANYTSMQRQSRVAHVKQNMHVVQLAVEEFATRNNAVYPVNAAATTAEGGQTLLALLPGASMPWNPFTDAPTTLDHTNVLGSVPATDPAGGVSVNVAQSVVGGSWDVYDITGADEANVQIALILGNY